MPPRKEPTRAQLSSRLAYSERTPAFLQKFKAKLSGHAVDDDEPQYEYDGDDRYESIDTSRPAIPVRPTSPPPTNSTPARNDRDEDEEDDDEWQDAQIVVLKEGKHLSEKEAEDIRRKEKGLGPLASSETAVPELNPSRTKTKKLREPPPTLSFSSGKSQASTNSSSLHDSALASAIKKRKRAIAADEEHEDTNLKKQKKNKRPKKEKKTLLSFGDEA
ncbi:hypothetical protein DL96DRAFT_775484 [Flagelloscypha sp. PMI_526]|nr:hypothetical protein DL96DRAFT_775484 [Flagelloscypha sp. PMI_526]